MEIRKSPEIEAVISRWIAAEERKQASVLVNLLSSSEHLRYIGSDDGEYWSGELLRAGFGDHICEVPDFSARCFSMEAFECGEVGWATWIGELRFAVKPDAYVFRFSWVLVLEDGVWKIVQSHVSTPRPNIEVIGIDHFSLSALIAAAREGDHDFGDEGTAVIMFTDVASSSRIASTLGDREWALTIGRLLDEQEQQIEQHGGTLVKTLGDGTMSCFPAAKRAIRAAIAIQNANSRGGDAPALQLRVGIHAGDVIQSKGDFFGTVVNKAARITAPPSRGRCWCLMLCARWRMIMAISISAIRSSPRFAASGARMPYRRCDGPYERSVQLTPFAVCHRVARSSATERMLSSTHSPRRISRARR